MTDRDALLQAVIENPHDDLPRLILADYLDENGESERAEFIRVQCELSRFPKICGGGGLCRVTKDRIDHRCEICRAKDDLHQRENMLWNSSVQRAMIPNAFNVVMSRGFVSKITLSWHDFLKNAGNLLSEQPVERVRFVDLGRLEFLPNDTWVTLRDENRHRIEFGRNGRYGNGILPNEWSCDRWPMITFEMPEPNNH